ncbi:aminopeptidase N [Terricaulis silvestris]|uniref:Aminopeptidase N n=1 Tax=Terricaulis silvestris TaxID=2686094 RepID=A0A6I6MQ88_9CAUL|nr:aminopeptidase N [Terricaulis silvestris]QGZ95568.1 Aminopeptidase N [Terricaulis silvestris]
MRDAETTTVRLSEYTPPAYLIDEIALVFSLEPEATLVAARSHVRCTGDTPAPLVLNGERLELQSIAIDGALLTTDKYELEPGKLIILDPPVQFRLDIVTRISPATNTHLDGLYMSGGRFCTQCEAEGFRAITYMLDRPDVLARYAVRIEANKAAYPTLLSNGNKTESGDMENGRHFAVWVDPHPKPSYLFALCAGKYESIHDAFVTKGGRNVALGIYVDPGDSERARYAMDALKRSMKWDEDTFQREYDLDVFNIVAVRDFNFGAMENKGLNIFNSSLILADAETATDADFEAIEAVVGHEYFHNWTGNRITCRDWFQLCLKEGLTVYREQEFSADQRSRPVQRIKDVKRLRARQFGEDAGPLAHAVRPSSYQKIDNFYTATVYEKGGEVIRMLKRLIGKDAFERGMQLYFERRDGTASTVEDFIGCFEETAGRKLDDFMRWYDQAGTPALKVHGDYDAAAKTYHLTVSQRTAPTPGQTSKHALPIPLQVGFIAPDGAIIAGKAEGDDIARTEHHLVLNDAQRTFRFSGVLEEPIPTVLRGFSAPVTLDQNLTIKQRLAQIAHDPDPFTRWEAGQAIARGVLLGEAPEAAPALAEALGRELDRAQQDPAFAALALRLPDLNELLLAAEDPDPEALHISRETLRRAIASKLRDRLLPIASTPSETPFSPGADAAGRRSLKAAALDLLAALGPELGETFVTVFDGAQSMTEAMAALDALGASGSDKFDAALTRFYERWRANPLVIDKWFAVQAASPRDNALDRAERLRTHAEFNTRNPNRVRALAAAFAMRNPRAFHERDGGGYRFLAALAQDIDPHNPALAARLLTPFESWKRFDASRQAHARAALEHLAALPTLSKNTREMVERTLA